MMTAVLLALVLSQVEAPSPEDPSHAPRHSVPPRPLPSVTQTHESPLPLMNPEGPIGCVQLAPTPQVPSGLYRAQCDEATKRCLVAPSAELEPDGTESLRPLERLAPCDYQLQDRLRHDLADYTFEPAIADASPGWYRDERGRVMQFNFDLHRRVWLGGGWAPEWTDGAPGLLSRGRVDFGFTTEFPSGHADRVHRITLLDTQLVLGAHSTLDGVLFRYDTNVRPRAPQLRVSTFIGPPHRFDLSIDMGWWLELVRIEQLRREGVFASYVRLGDLQLTLDLWHSMDLASYVRVRAGPSLEYDGGHGFFTLVPSATLEGDLTLDRDGFHHFTFGASAEKVFFDPVREGRPQHPERLRTRVGYELILLAINDQPLSLVVDAHGQQRDDIEGVPARWEWSVQTGLRFSLWAPVRRSAPLARER